jgi:hypothetical protein
MNSSLEIIEGVVEYCAAHIDGIEGEYGEKPRLSAFPETHCGHSGDEVIRLFRNFDPGGD